MTTLAHASQVFATRVSTASKLRLAGRVVLSTRLDREGQPVAGEVDVRGDEGVVVEITSTP